MTCPICHRRLGNVSTVRFHNRQVHIDCLIDCGEQTDATAGRGEYGTACSCASCTAIRAHYAMEVPA